MFVLQRNCKDRPWAGYTIAVLAVGTALFVQRLLTAHLGGQTPTYVTFFPAVVVTGLIAGFGPGVVATMLATAVVDAWVLSPHELFWNDTAAEALGLIMFMVLGLLINVLLELYGRARDKAALYDKTLALRESQQALHEEAEQRQLALEAGNLGTWNYDFKTGKVFWDERCRSLFGLRQGDHIQYQDVIKLMHAADREEVDRAVQAAMQPGSDGLYEHEYRVVWPDHSMHWVAARGRVYFQGEGASRKPVQFIGTLQDITERKQISEALRFLAQCGTVPGDDFFGSLARFLAENLGMDYVCIDAFDGEARKASPVVLLLDGKVQENGSYDLNDLACGETLGKKVCCIPSSFHKRFPGNAMLGKLAAESYLGTTLLGLGGHVIGFIALIGRRPLANPRSAEHLLQFVSPRAAVELERRETEQKLRNSHEELAHKVRERTSELQRTMKLVQAERQRFQDLLDKLPAYVVLLSPDYRVQFENRLFRERFGQSLGRRCYESLFQRTEPCENCKTFTVLKTQAPYQWEWLGPDGGTYEVHDAPFADTDGSPLILEVGLDVSERKTSERQEQQLRSELARASRITTAGQLAASLAHELNQPLGAIACNVQAIQQLIAHPNPDHKEIAEALRDIAADSQRAGSVIHQLRRLYQRTGQTRTSLSLNELVEKTAELLRSEFVLKQVDLQLDLHPDLPQVEVNEVELQQVVLNLLTNAVEAMGSIELGARFLALRTSREGPTSVRCSITDSGMGIRAEELGRIFDAFFTTKQNGMGMGLAISHSIIEAHGGRLWAENNADRGATFHFSLPAGPNHHESH